MKYLLLYTLVILSIPCIGQKRMVISFDDLPMAQPKISLEHTIEINKKILHQLKSHNVPAIGFVNESQINIFGETEERINILRMWVEQGLELGNHTYSHKDYNNTNFCEFVGDIEKGEIYTRQIMEESGKEIRFFRPPYLSTGRTLAEKAKLTDFLAKKGYSIAPFTIESADFIFNLIYLKAQTEGDSALMKSTIKKYIAFNSRRLDYFEKATQDLKGSLTTPQIFLYHVNALNADCLDQLLSIFIKRGYDFISLEEALQDEAYRYSDNYVGAKGISWIYRWNSHNRPKLMKGEPSVESKILDQYKEVEKNQFQILFPARVFGLTTAMKLIFGIFFFISLSLTVGFILNLYHKKIKRSPNLR